MNILAIDPSTTIVGWAFGNSSKLISFGIVKGDTKKDPLDRMPDIARDIALSVKSTGANCTHLIMEEPVNWASEKGGKAALSGALCQLSLGAGFLYGALQSMLYPGSATTVTVNKWKGQLPKGILFDRMCKKYRLTMKPTGANFNATDAIGIMDWYLEQLKGE